MAIVVGNYSYAGSSAASSIAIAPPTGITAGDLLLLMVTAGDNTYGNNVGIAVPSEFTNVLVSQSMGLNSKFAFKVAYRLASGAEPSSYTVGFSGGINYLSTALIRSFRGVGAVDATAASSGGATTSTSLVAPSVTPGAGNTSDLLVCAWGAGSGSAATAPAGMVDYTYYYPYTGTYIADKQLTTDTATGDRTLSTLNAAVWAAASILLAPPGAPVLVPLWENF